MGIRAGRTEECQPGVRIPSLAVTPTSRSRIQGVSGSKPGKRILRSLSRRIRTFTLEQRQEEGQPHTRTALRVPRSEDLDPAPHPRVLHSRGLGRVLLEPPRVPDGGQGALQHLDVHCKKQKFPVFPGHLCSSRTGWAQPGRRSRCSSGSSLRRLGGTVVIRIFTVASAELISKPVSLVSMVRTAGGKMGIPRGRAGNLHRNSPARSGAQPHLRWGPVPAGSPPLCSPRLPRLPLGRRRRKRRRSRVGARPGTEGRWDPARGWHSQVGRIFRITTRSATLCPVVIVPFL